ncbi:MAG: LacI family DNA-binding transcriptional regulator [Blautia sp.]|nr:LacI family DNA-binding transcriptional regulator [Blautia sp.]
MREVAALTGVSIATVSRVMNNDTTYKITEETRDKAPDRLIEGSRRCPKGRVHHQPPGEEGLRPLLSVHPFRYRELPP